MKLFFLISNIHDYFPYCGRHWLRKCASPIHEDLVVGLLLKPMQQTMREICSNSSLRKGTKRMFFRKVLIQF